MSKGRLFDLEPALKRCTICMGLNCGRHLADALGLRCNCVLLGPSSLVPCTPEVATVIADVGAAPLARSEIDPQMGHGGYTQWRTSWALALHRSLATGIPRDLSLVPTKGVATLEVINNELEAGLDFATAVHWIWVVLFTIENAYDVSDGLGHKLRRWTDPVLTAAKVAMTQHRSYHDWTGPMQALRALRQDLVKVAEVLPDYGPLLDPAPQTLPFLDLVPMSDSDRAR